MSGSRARWFLVIGWLLVFLAVPGAGQGTRRPKNEADQGERDKPRERELYFRRGRTLMGETGAALRYRAYQQKLAKRQGLNAQSPSPATSGAQGTQQLTAPSSPTGSPWESLGPAPITVDSSSGTNYGLTAGRLTSVVVDQTDTTGNTVYIGAAYGGVWKSTNAAALDPNTVQWTPLIDDQPTLAVGAIALQPGNSNLILVGTGEPNQSRDSYYGLGILRSTDGGATWNLITTADNGVTEFKGLGFSKITFSPSNPDLVVAASSSTNSSDFGIGTNNTVGIYYSTDAGATWFSANVTDSGVTTSRGSTSTVVFHPGLNMFFAAIRYHGFYSSSDGINWSRLAVQPGTALTPAACPANVSFNCPMGRAEIAINPTAPVNNDMYVWFVDENDVNKGMFKTSNGGANWTSMTLTGITSCGDNFGGCGTEQGTYNLELAAIPNGSNLDLYAGAINIFKCRVTATNPTCSATGSWLNLTHVYGCTIFAQNSHVHPDQHALDFSRTNPNIIYFANDGGIYRTLNGPGLTSGTCSVLNPFDDLNTNLGSITEQVSFSQHPTDDRTLLSGSQDNGSQAVDAAHDGVNGSTWLNVNAGDGGFNAIDPNSPLIWYSTNTDVSIQRCTSGINCDFLSFIPIISNSNVGTDHGDFYTPYILDPGLPSRIIIGTCRVWRGPSTGGTQSALSFNFDTATTTACTGNESNLVSALAAGGVPNANGSPVIYAGTYNGQVFVRTNATTGATLWSSSSLGLFKVSDIVVDRTDTTGFTAYATVMGFGGMHVLKTTNGGQSWFNFTGDLPDAPADSVALDPLDHNIVYVGTDIGVFVTTDRGGHYTEWGTGLPNVPVTRVLTFVNGAKKKLRVSTYGRGTWQTDLVTASPFRMEVSPDSASVLVGEPATFTVTLFSQGGFTGTVTVSCNGNPLPASCVGATVSPTPTGTQVTVTASDPSVDDFSFTIKGVASDASNTSIEIPVTLHTSDIQLSPLTPSSVVVKRGTASDPVAFTVTGLGQLPAAVLLGCSGLPNGASCTFQPSWFVIVSNGSSANASVVVNTDPQADVGTFSPEITATAAGSAPDFRTQPLSLEVDLNPDFLLIANPNSLTSSQLTSSILVNARDAYAGSVVLSCSVDLPGPTCSIPSAPITTFPTYVPLTVNLNGTSAGTFHINVVGDDGTHQHTIVLPLFLPDFAFQPSPQPNVTTLTAYSGQWAFFYTNIISLSGYSGMVVKSCDASAIPGSSCVTQPPVFVGVNASVVESVQIFVPLNVLSGTFPVHIHAQDAAPGTPQHDIDITVTVQGFTLNRGAVTEHTGPFNVTSQAYELTYTPTGGFNQTVQLGGCGSQWIFCTITPNTVSSATTVTVTLSTYDIVPPSEIPNGDIVVTPKGYFAPPGQFSSLQIPADGPLTYHIQDFQVLSPGQLSIIPGSSQQVQVSINQYHVTTPVSVSCVATGGITCSANPATLPGTGAVTVTLIASPTATIGTQTFTTSATGTVSGNQLTRFSTGVVLVRNFTQSVTPTSATVPPGGSANYTASYTGSNFFDFIQVGCANPPAGTTCTANPPQVFPGQSSTVTVGTTAGVTPASSTFAITGTALGVTKSSNVTLRIADFSFTSSTTTATINTASSVSASLRATALNGFNSSVVLSCPPVATGITCSFSPSSLIPSTSGSSITATIRTTASTPPGVYTVPLTATASNGTTHVINFTLTVRSFHMTVQPGTAITPVGGGTAHYTVTLFADQGFSSLVSLSCGAGLPTGVGPCSFSPASLIPTAGGVSSTLSVPVTSSAAQATVPIQVKGTASPLVLSQNVTLQTRADFSLATVTGQQTIKQTQTADFDLTLTAINGMNLPVTLSCTGLPAGANCSFDSNPVTPTAQGQNVTVHVQTTLASPPNVYTVTVSGAAGGLTRSTALSLNLQAFPDFVFSIPDPLGAVRPGQAAQYSATISKNGVYTSVVDLSCAGAMPTGANCQVSPTQVNFSLVSSAPVTVTVSTAGNTPLGDTSFSLHGAEQGGPKTHDLPLILRVNDFHLSPPTGQTFAQTDIATYSVTVFGDNQFASPVTLACNNLPAGVGPCSFSLNTFVPSGAGTTVTVSAPIAANAPVGLTSFDVGASGGGVSHTVTEPLTIILVQDFTLAPLGPASQTVFRGQSVTFGFTLTPLNSFQANDLAFSVSGCPTGATCSVPNFPNSIGNQTPVNLALQVQTSATTPVANANLTLTVSGGGKTHSQIFTAVVQSFSVTISPTSRTVGPGAGAQYTVTLNGLNGFNQLVLMGCGTLPVGVSCSANPAVINPGQTTIMTVMTTSSVSGTKTIPMGGALGLGAPVINTSNASLTVSSTVATYTMTTPSLVKVAPIGTSVTVPVTVRATSTLFTGTLVLSCVTNQPISCSFSANNFRPTTTNRVVNVTVNPNALATGSYPFIIQGLASNQVRRLAMTLNVADFSIVVNPASQTISSPGGGSANYTVTAFTSSNFSSAVTLSCPGLPAGWSCLFSPATIIPSAGGTNSTLTLTTTSAPTGAVNLTVQASASGLTHQFPIEVINGQDFALDANPQTISVPQGGNNATNIGVNAIGQFSGPVTLSCLAVSPPPAAGALTCSFPSGNTPLAGTSVPLQLSASADLAGGVYTVPVQGTGGSVTHSTSVTVNVPDYTLGLTLGVSDVIVGSPAAINGSATALGGFSANVSLACSVTPPLTCSGVPANVTPTVGGTGFNFSVTVPNGTAPGTYLLQLSGDDGAGHIRTAPLNLVVRDFTVAVNPTSGTIEAGTQTTVGGTATGINGFAGAVQLQCAPDPNISCQFTPPSVNASPGGTPFSVTIVTAPITPPNTYNVTVEGVAAGQQRGAAFSLTVTPTNDFNLSVPSPSATINAGEDAAFAVQLTQVNSFDADVTLTCNGSLNCTAPASPIHVPPGANTLVTVHTTSGQTSAGTYPLTITGSGGGKTHSQNISVTVRDFSLALSPPSQTVLPGATADYLVGMSSASGFPNDALLTCSIAGSPAGAACSFDLNDLTAGASTTLHVTTDVSTPIGSYTVTVTATSNLTVHSAAVTIVVGGPDFTFTANTTTVDVIRGQNAVSLPVTLAALAGFNASVSFSCTQPGPSCTAPAALVPAPGGSSTSFSFRASNRTAVGSYPVTLTATGGGKTHTLDITVNVN